MKIKSIAAIALLAGMVGLAGCYDVGPGGYGYGGGGGGYPGYAYSAPMYGSAYPAYGGYWRGGGYAYPEHPGYIAHDYRAPGYDRGFAVAHNEGFRGGYNGFHGNEAHPAAVHAPAANFHASGASHTEAAHGGHGEHR